MGKLIEQLKRHEGFRKTAYKCTAGKWTIGYGCNLDAMGVDHEGLVWNESYAEHVLIDKVDAICVEMGVVKISDSNYEEDAAADALINMAFNLGCSGLGKFKKMLEAVINDDLETASKEMLDSRWAKQVGARAVELAEQVRTNRYQF